MSATAFQRRRRELADRRATPATDMTAIEEKKAKKKPSSSSSTSSTKKD